MFQVMIIVGWLIACGCLIYLAVELLRNRLIARRFNKIAAKGTKESTDSHIDSNRQQSFATIGGGDAPSASTNRWRAIVGYVMLFLWEAFWVSEIFERTSQTSKPLQLPYFFLLGVMVGVPIAVYLLSRWMLREMKS